MEASRPHVLIVSDHLAARRGLELVLREAGFAVTLAAAEPHKASAALLTGDHDVALVEIHRHAGDAIELVREAVAERDGARVVLCASSVRPTGPLLAAAGLGAPGLVLTSSEVGTVVRALRTVARGGSFVDPALAGLLAEGSPALRVSQLSPREREVLGLLADGLQGPEIAERLFLSLETVRTHIRNGAGKLGARTRVQAAAMVARARDEDA
jgi:DNA-binding NarL/FixJ family response regulator